MGWARVRVRVGLGLMLGLGFRSAFATMILRCEIQSLAGEPG